MILNSTVDPRHPSLVVVVVAVVAVVVVLVLD